VPQVDADGNEVSGVRTPEQRVPMATYTGWNFRNAHIGGGDQIVNLLGSAVPFRATKADRDKVGDPRKSVAERYPSRAAYTEARCRRGPGHGRIPAGRRCPAGHAADGPAVGARHGGAREHAGR
jgi:hypothetical protein